MLFLKAFRGNGWTLHGRFSPDWPREDLSKVDVSPFAMSPKSPAPKLLLDEWTPVTKPKMCQEGWHLAPCNAQGIGSWIREDRCVFLAEIAEGCTAKFHSSHPDKLVVSEAALVRELTDSEIQCLLAKFGTVGSKAERARLRDGAKWFKQHYTEARARSMAVPRYGYHRRPARITTVKVRSEDLQ